MKTMFHSADQIHRSLPAIDPRSRLCQPDLLFSGQVHRADQSTPVSCWGNRESNMAKVHQCEKIWTNIDNLGKIKFVHYVIQTFLYIPIGLNGGDCGIAIADRYIILWVLNFELIGNCVFNLVGHHHPPVMYVSHWVIANCATLLDYYNVHI